MKASSLLGLVAGVAFCTTTQAAATGAWNFDGGNLDAAIGSALQYRGTTAAQFGTTTSFGIPNIGGQVASVMQFPATDVTQGFIMTHGAAANGGGTYVNQYTVMYDLYWPGDPGDYRALFQTSESNANDGDFFVNGDGGIGISSNYQGNLDDGAWHRVAAVFDLPTSTLSKYIDGTLVGAQTLSSGVDGRWSLGTTALLFADEDGETDMGYVNSIAFFDTALSGPEVAAFGGPTAAGIIPEPGTLSLALLALIGTGGWCWLRKRA
ncbi:MAG TPA: hypothetical protein PKM73_21220 [Verrucomicrobiota bacterium]|nr:hypothetical protein [Verrucomicrobiota bacterium]HNU53280.1 hypothetical protein [Verrucomicrobiota bacterium]